MRISDWSSVVCSSDLLFTYSIEADGGNDTVNRATARLGGNPDTLFEDVHGAGFRAVYDLENLDRSRFMIATGQSGNPLSHLYGNLTLRWRDGQTVSLAPETWALAEQLSRSEEHTSELQSLMRISYAVF